MIDILRVFRKIAGSAIVAAPLIFFAVGCGTIGSFPNSADTVTVYTTPPPLPSTAAVPEAVPMGPAG